MAGQPVLRVLLPGLPIPGTVAGVRGPVPAVATGTDGQHEEVTTLSLWSPRGVLRTELAGGLWCPSELSGSGGCQSRSDGDGQSRARGRGLSLAL